MSRAFSWTPAADELLRQRYGIDGAYKLAGALGTKPRNVRQRAYQLCLPVHAHAGWSREEHEVLIEKYPAGGLDACAAALPGRSRAAITTRVGFLGLRMNEQCRHEVYARNGRLSKEAANQARPDHSALSSALGMSRTVPPSIASMPPRVVKVL